MELAGCSRLVSLFIYPVTGSYKCVGAGKGGAVLGRQSLLAVSEIIRIIQ